MGDKLTEAQVRAKDGPAFCDGPFYLQKETDWICGTDAFGGLCHIAAIRGWGYLTGHGQEALQLSNLDAIAIQTKTAQFIVDAMNAALAALEARHG